jgi:hypothetical protein
MQLLRRKRSETSDRHTYPTDHMIAPGQLVHSASHVFNSTFATKKLRNRLRITAIAYRRSESVQILLGPHLIVVQIRETHFCCSNRHLRTNRAKALIVPPRVVELTRNFVGFGALYSHHRAA